MPYLTALADFRDSVRKEAIPIKASNILKTCDSLRDDVLPDLGVRLEDKENEPTVIKLVDKNDDGLVDFDEFFDLATRSAQFVNT